VASAQWLTGLVCSLMVTALAAQDAASGAKALFCTDSAICSGAPAPKPRPQPGAAAPAVAPAVAGAFGLSYWVDLQQPNGELARVSTDRKFSTGERIRLSMRPNRPGYLYVFNLGTSGQTTALFPRGTESARAEAGQLVQVPGSNFLRFASPPGEDLLLVVFSPTPIADFAGRQTAVDNKTVLHIADARGGAKDLMRDDDFDAPGASNASYVVVPRTEKAVNLSIRLRHQ